MRTRLSLKNQPNAVTLRGKKEKSKPLAWAIDDVNQSFNQAKYQSGLNRKSISRTTMRVDAPSLTLANGLKGY